MARSKDEGSVGQKSRPAYTVILIIFFTVLGVIVIIPFYANLLASLKPGNALISDGLNLKIEPDRMTLDNWRLLFSGTHNYFKWFWNSMFLTIVRTIAILMIGAFVGYGFACYRFKGKKAMFLCVIMTMMVPFEIIMLPLYIEIKNLGMINTYTAVILPFIANASAIFFFRQFLIGIPVAIIDSGRVDGATEYGIYFKLIMPLMKPAFAAMAILNAMAAWNDFLWPQLVLGDELKFTLPIGLNSLLTPYKNGYDLLVVGAFFAVFPILIVFLAFQRYFLEGMTAGAVKG